MSGRGQRAAPAIAALSLLAVAGLASATPAHAEFGLQRFAISARNQNGTPDVQAGSHPYALTTTFVLNQPPCVIEESKRTCVPEGNIKDTRVELPPGFVGNPNATPRCTYQEFIKGETPRQIPGCSNEAAVGAATAFVGISAAPGNVFEIEGISEPVFNLVPPPGVAAEFGFIVAGSTPVLLQTSVRTGRDYGLTTTASDTNQAVLVTAAKVTIWGVPASAAHNRIRGACVARGTKANHPLEEPGWGLREGEDELEGPIGPYAAGSGSPLEAEKNTEAKGGCPTQAPLLPLLTNPTSCGVSRTATLGVDSWREPGVFKTKEASLPELLGCEKLDFSPTVTVKPDGEAGSTPTGLNVALHVPQETTENPVGLAEADVRDTTVTLPAGVQLSPSAADGLQSCPQLHGEDPAKEAQEENHELSGVNLGTKQPANCPDASKVANVRIKSPLLEHELTGSMYLAAPQNFAGLPENPFSSKVALYLVAEEHERGVLIKLAGNSTPCKAPGEVVQGGVTCQAAGQLVTTFEDTPQLPFTELKAEFFGTARAPLATPALCGSYTTTATFTPWSATPPVSPTSTFPIVSGPNGSACSNPLPFSPSLSSGTTNINAGSFTPLTTTITREDGQQNMQSVVLHYPPGVSGMLKGVPLCPEAQANAGTCSEESKIGETIVSVGLGNDPFSVTGGKVYLTEKHAGAPFGLSIVNPAKAGPFDLQHGAPVVVRAKIEIDPRTAALTVTTGDIPSIIEGFPLQIKHVNVLINRPGFTFNPTSCDPSTVTGAITAWEGASSPVSTPFQVANCATLKYEPQIQVTTGAKSSKVNGASLLFKIAYPKGAMGAQSWFNEAKFDLPKQLPARLTTIQKACLAATFESNRAACPAASIIGHAIVHTQVLPVPLEGPVYFVSYGGAKFPDAVLVLDGYGVHIELHGETFIKNGVTSATFRNTPDVPFESIEVSIPTGPYSEFGANLPASANGSFCGQKLVMPTLFKAQNGLEINENVNIAVSGCPKALTAKQKLAAALKACHKKHGKKRATCERAARRAYGAKAAKTKKTGHR